MIPFFSSPGIFEGCRDVAAIGVPGCEELPPDWLVAVRYEPARLSMPTGIGWRSMSEDPQPQPRPKPLRYVKRIYHGTEFTPTRIFYQRDR